MARRCVITGKAPPLPKRVPFGLTRRPVFGKDQVTTTLIFPGSGRHVTRPPGGFRVSGLRLSLVRRGHSTRAARSRQALSARTDLSRAAWGVSDEGEPSLQLLFLRSQPIAGLGQPPGWGHAIGRVLDSR